MNLDLSFSPSYVRRRRSRRRRSQEDEDKEEICDEEEQEHLQRRRSPMGWVSQSFFFTKVSELCPGRIQLFKIKKKKKKKKKSSWDTRTAVSQEYPVSRTTQIRHPICRVRASHNFTQAVHDWELKSDERIRCAEGHLFRRVQDQIL